VRASWGLSGWRGNFCREAPDGLSFGDHAPSVSNESKPASQGCRVRKLASRFRRLLTTGGVRSLTRTLPRQAICFAENVSNCALCSSDLLLSMASPQNGQCRIGGRGRDLYFQPDRFREQYAADLPETETKLLALTQRPMAERAMTEMSDVAAWKAIPSWFIFGTRDNSIPANLLAFMAERAGSKKTVTIEGASHAVMMSHADAVVELVEQAAAAVG
jgi:Alpha/beta hydrolase family